MICQIRKANKTKKECIYKEYIYLNFILDNFYVELYIGLLLICLRIKEK